jgi:hypothetical protein
MCLIDMTSAPKIAQTECHKNGPLRIERPACLKYAAV